VTDTESAPARYQLQVTGPAARALAGRLPDKIAAAVCEFITTALLENPRGLGKRLVLPPYEPKAGQPVTKLANEVKRRP
jgi:hypothetical protein